VKTRENPQLGPQNGDYSAAQRWDVGWLRLVGSLKLQVSFAEYILFYRALLQKETYNFKERAHRSHPIG